MLSKKGKKWKWGIKINKKRISLFFWGIFFIWLIIAIVYSNFKIFQKRLEMRKDLEKLDMTVENLTKEKEKLRFTLGETYSSEYLEKVAREDLGMQKSGETIVVIKKDQGGDINSDNKNNNIFEIIFNWIKSRF